LEAGRHGKSRRLWPSCMRHRQQYCHPGLIIPDRHSSLLPFMVKSMIAPFCSGLIHYFVPSLSDSLVAVRTGQCAFAISWIGSELLSRISIVLRLCTPRMITSLFVSSAYFTIASRALLELPRTRVRRSDRIVPQSGLQSLDEYGIQDQQGDPREALLCHR
jgi:hypothetical protein